MPEAVSFRSRQLAAGLLKLSDTEVNAMDAAVEEASTTEDHHMHKILESWVDIVLKIKAGECAMVSWDNIVSKLQASKSAMAPSQLQEGALRVSGAACNPSLHGGGH